MGVPWSDSDVAYLYKNYSTKNTREVADYLGRSVTAVKCKASDLSITKSSESISETMRTRYDSTLLELNKLSVQDVPLDIAFKHKEWLKFHYVNQELSQSDIAELTRCTRENIRYWLKKHGIKTRDDIESRTKRFREKISTTSKGRVPFSKGLNKHNHPSIMSISIKMSGEKSANWKGGFTYTSGYRRVRADGHPNCDRDGYVLEHRLVMEFLLGRLLEPGEVVHHRDSNRKNNFSNNLFLFPSNSAHSSFHNYKKYIDSSISEEKYMEEVYLCR